MIQLQDDPAVIVVGRQAGTAHAFSPVIRALHENKNINTAVIAFSPAHEVWKSVGIESMKIESYREAERILNGIHNPRFMLTGTSSYAAEDAYFWDWAFKRSVPSLAFVDHWVNYWQRFSSGLDGTSRFDVVPEKIAVIDQLAVTRMIEAGCPARLLLITGHPGFDDLPRFRDMVNHEVRDRIMPSDCYSLVLFLSEPHSQTYKTDKDSALGYTEEDALALTLIALERAGKDRCKRFCVAVKPHPIEEPTRIARVLEAYKELEYVTAIIVDGHRYELVTAADAVVGMTSVLLYEATLMGRPVISVQPNRLRQSDLADFHEGIEVVTDVEQAQIALEVALKLRDGERAPFNRSSLVNFNATNAFLSYILIRVAQGK
jgi:hypothetical protein